jgi:hypothetical protein
MTAGGSARGTTHAPTYRVGSVLLFEFEIPSRDIRAHSATRPDRT